MDQDIIFIISIKTAVRALTGAISIEIPAAQAADMALYDRVSLVIAVLMYPQWVCIAVIFLAHHFYVMIDRKVFEHKLIFCYCQAVCADNNKKRCHQEHL
jgi:hypothetical protein